MAGKGVPKLGNVEITIGGRKHNAGEVRTTSYKSTSESASSHTTGRLSVNAVTGSAIDTAQRLRVENQVGSGYKVGHLSTSGTNVSETAAKNALAKMSGMLAIGNTAFTALQSKMKQSPDLGTESVGQTISLGNTAYMSFRAAQKTTEIAVKTSGTAAKVTCQAALATKDAIKGIAHRASRTVRVVHGVATGTVSIAHVKRDVAQQARMMAREVKTRVKTRIATGVKLLRHDVVQGGSAILKSAPKGIKNASLFGAGVLTKTDDYALQGVGHTINAAHFGIKTAVQAGKMAGKVGGYSVKTAKTAVKVGKQVKAGYAFIKNKGLKSAFQAARKKARKKLAEAGKSLVSAVINIVKSVGTKFVVPLLLIIVVAGGFTMAVSVPATAVGSIFGGIFNKDGKGDDIEVREYLADPSIGVPAIVLSLKEDIKNEVKTALEDKEHNDIVRFQSDVTGKDIFFDLSKGTGENLTIENFDTAFPEDEQIVSMLQPMYNAVVLMKYDLAPSEAEAKELMEYMFSKVFTLESKDTVEVCGQNLLTGEGEGDSPCGQCGEIHAHSDCPNVITGKHSSYTCSTCCYYYCDGTHGEDSDEWWGDDCCHDCFGYRHCGEHKVKTFNLAVDGIYTLIDEYFQEPINTISAIPEADRTDEQKEQLQTLKDYLEIFWEMVNQMGENYGFNMSGNLSVADLVGVTFEQGTRRGCQEVINTALGQVGLKGGRPFWQYYGFSERVEWCACFVHWCMRCTPYTASRYPTTENNAYCPSLTKWFKNNSQWADGGYTDLAAGDVIFFDWDSDGKPNHVGLVIGRSGDTVYTVEGNSGDEVRIKTYGVGSSVIHGYGLMNYEP